MISREGIIKVY